MSQTETTGARPACDVIVVGAGFAGIYALWTARQRGLGVRGFEAGSDVGGTWYWNAYPGARCDVDSYSYAYFFDSDLVRQWDWSDVCAGQKEIQRYLRHVADRCDVVRDITFGTRVTSARYLPEAGLWSVGTSGGETVTCRYLVLAVGALSQPKAPDIPGVDDFAGPAWFTSSWPRDRVVDLSGKRVGVIGTGSSGVQVIPEIAKVASQVTVFQRTANFVTPTNGGPMDPARVAGLRADPQAVRRDMRETYGGTHPLNIGTLRHSELDDAGRERELWKAWEGGYIALAFRDAHTVEANAAISEFIRQRMREQVKDPWTAERIVPWDHPYGGKRPCQSDVYLQAYNRPNVRLVSLRETPIERIVAEGIVTSAGTVPLDVIVYATGFDALTGPVRSMDLAGIDGVRMNDVWSDGPVNYLGTMVRGFPNLFLPSSAMSPSVLSNMATLAEQQVDFVFDCIDWLEAHGRPALQPKAESQEFWREETLRYARRVPGALSTNSWYNGANIPGKPRQYMVYRGGFKRYNETCYDELERGFPGYELLRTDAA
ncbi:MAG: NAD(P)/FAD-dependent oxidoreductase [Pseudomonadota bacterium]|nr:NAD(P)/FAD-dependent oxidoreductase [Pseudomonadota bacterium]